MENYVKNTIISELSAVVGVQNIKINEPLRNHTSFKIGGPCDFLIIPSKTSELVEVIKLLKEEGLNYFIMGNGSNLLIKDGGIRGFVIKTENILECDIEKDQVSACAGILLSKLAKMCYEAQLAGFEFASGIPGTLGGAVFMNAGAYDGEMSHVVLESTYLDANGNIDVVVGEEHDFGYRQSIFQKNNGVILSSKIKLVKGNKEDILAKMKDLNERRRDKQPVEMPSAGSVFKRPEGTFAGKLIMDSGLKGMRIGGAIVSEKHAGFIVNTGNATAKDVIDLINLIREEVYKRFEVELIPEIKIVGE